jgi:cysteine-rich repeat protein
LIERRPSFASLACALAPAALCAVLGASCAPNEQAQTVSFVLARNAARLSEIEFVVSYAGGKFAATDGQCVVSSAAGPRSFAAAEAQLLEQDRLKTASRHETDEERVVVRGVVTSSTSPSSSTTTLAPTTTTLVLPTTTVAAPTTTLAGNDSCGDRVIDDGEECDDGDVISGDGCDGNCQAEFSFSAIDDEEGELTIRITNGLGIPAGASLAFCKFQGDIETAEIGISTLTCSRSTGGGCTPTTDAVVSISITTTTTTTTRSTTTTIAGGDTTTTSSTLP